MFTYNLTDEQKNLLSLVVRTIREKSIENDFLCAFDMQGADIIGIEGRFSHSLKPNLFALADSDLITLERTGQYDLTFSVKQAGFDAVDNNFESLVLPSRADLSIGAVFFGNVNGNIQAVGFADHSEIQQILSDPGLLHAKIDEYLDKLIEQIRSELTRKQHAEYLAASEEFKDEMTAENPEPSKVLSLLQTLAFLGDVEGTISLAARVWPYLYPLIVLAAERFS